jgi:hypothetical protein
MRHYITTDANRRVILDFFSAPNDQEAKAMIEEEQDGGEDDMLLFRLEQVSQ